MNTALTPTEQEKVEQAAKDYETCCRMYGSPSTPAPEHFKAGASYYEKECMPGMMGKLLAWALVNGYETNDKRSWIKIGKSRSAIYTTTELVNLFLSHLKQKDNELPQKTV